MHARSTLAHVHVHHAYAGRQAGCGSQDMQHAGTVVSTTLTTQYQLLLPVLLLLPLPLPLPLVLLLLLLLVSGGGVPRVEAHD